MPAAVSARILCPTRAAVLANARKSRSHSSPLISARANVYLTTLCFSRNTERITVFLFVSFRARSVVSTSIFVFLCFPFCVAFILESAVRGQACYTGCSTIDSVILLGTRVTWMSGRVEIKSLWGLGKIILPADHRFLIRYLEVTYVGYDWNEDQCYNVVVLLDS